MTVPESIRATAIEALTDAEFATLPDGYQYIRIGKHVATQVVDAVLPAVVAQVQADTLEKFADTLGVSVADEYDDYALGYRNGQRQALRKANEMAAEYREKGDNHE